MRSWRQWLGFEASPVSHGEKWVSLAGGLISIITVFWFSRYIVGNQGAAIIAASAGATAVLLFAAPHSQLTQPWQVVGGHLLSALVGVTCAKLVSNELIAVGLAVGTSIVVMFYARCLHPPGGATALSAVIGGDAVKALGYQYVVTPILLDTLIMLAIAVAFNNLFTTRWYPSGWPRKKDGQKLSSVFSPPAAISHEDFVYALSQLDTFVDISEDDLLRIYDLATGRARGRWVTMSDLHIGGDYSNGEEGSAWSVRRIIDEQRHEDPNKDLVIYRVVAGQGVRDTACVRRDVFLQWAKYELGKDAENLIRKKN